MGWDYARIQSSRDRDILPQGEVGGASFGGGDLDAGLVVIDRRGKRVDSQQKLGIFIAWFRASDCSNASEGEG